MKNLQAVIPVSIILIMSGVISAYTALNQNSNQYLWGLFPGFVFGICFGLFIYFKYNTPFLKTLIWILLSSATYPVAVFVIIIIDISEGLSCFGAGNCHPPGYIAYLIAGLIGAMILGLGIKKLISDSYKEPYNNLIIAGGIASLLFAFFSRGVLTDTPDDYNRPLYLSYVLWQLIVGLTLYYMIDRKFRLSSKN